MKAVVLGGGTGAPKSIRALLSLGFETDAVVAMADDGGSTGILRKKAGATPPGDIRKCLAAMAADPEAPLVKAFTRRFDFADDHALGNLVLYALEDCTGSFPEAIATCERLLDARGHVFPSTLSDVSFAAELSDGSVIHGQARACKAALPVRKAWLESSLPPEPYAPALDVLRDADVIVLGPGSLFTSIIVNLLIPGIAEAIAESSAKVVFVCPIGDTQGEARGFTARACYEALCDAGLRGRIDAMIAHWPKGKDVPQTSEPAEICPDVLSIALGLDDIHAIEQAGTRVLVSDLAGGKIATWHDEEALRAALLEVV